MRGEFVRWFVRRLGQDYVPKGEDMPQVRVCIQRFEDSEFKESFLEEWPPCIGRPAMFVLDAITPEANAGETFNPPKYDKVRKCLRQKRFVPPKVVGVDQARRQPHHAGTITGL